MKNTILIIILLTLATAFVPSRVQAQSFKKGIKGGYSLATLGGLNDYIDVAEVGTRHGFHLGAFGQLKIAIISIQLDALYSQQGAEYIDNANEEHSFKNNYLNFPLVGKLHLGPINFQAGLQYGFLLSSKVDDVKDTEGFFFKKADFGVPVGIGLDISILMLEARYILGLQDVSNITDYPFQNNVFQLSAGLKF